VVRAAVVEAALGLLEKEARQAQALAQLGPELLEEDQLAPTQEAQRRLDQVSRLPLAASMEVVPKHHTLLVGVRQEDLLLCS